MLSAIWRILEQAAQERDASLVLIDIGPNLGALNRAALQAARDEIWQSWRYTCAENADYPRAKELFDRHKLPAFHDPFAGGGPIPLERSPARAGERRQRPQPGGRADQQGDLEEARRQTCGAASTRLWSPRTG